MKAIATTDFGAPANLSGIAQSHAGGHVVWADTAQDLQHWPEAM
jgi:hypothetical protein